jgi:hypothetical protein
MFLLAVFGTWAGFKLHRLFRDRCKLLMFGHDPSDGKDPYRNPLSSQDGLVFLVFILGRRPASESRALHAIDAPRHPRSRRVVVRRPQTL